MGGRSASDPWLGPASDERLVIMVSQGIRGATYGEGTCVEHAHNPAGSGTLSLYLTNRKTVIGLRYFAHVSSDAVEFEWKKSLEI